MAPRTPDLAAARARVAAGLPALDLTSFEPDWSAVLELVRATCLAAPDEYRAVTADLAAITLPELGMLARRHLAETPCDGVLGAILTRALRPSLRAVAAALAPVLDASARHRWCPVCGGPPDLAALDPDGARRLVCGRCDTEWRWQRLGCPHCGNDSPDSLAHFTTGESGAYRLYVCERCKRYLKTIDLRARWQDQPLAVERELTIGLDIAAVREGYRVV